MKTTRYFKEQVLSRRPDLKKEWCQKAILESVKKEIKPDRRIRHRIYITELGKYEI